jgi:hypothetical protein
MDKLLKETGSVLQQSTPAGTFCQLDGAQFYFPHNVHAFLSREFRGQLILCIFTELFYFESLQNTLFIK